MNDAQLADYHARPAYWTPELDDLCRSLDEPARGVSALEQQVVAVAEAATAAGSWASIFEAWGILARRHEHVTSGEVLTVWASLRRKAVDLERCRPELDFRLFEADLVLGVWPELRWLPDESPPEHASSECEGKWLGLWQMLLQAATADPGADNNATSLLDEDHLAPLVAFSRLIATVFAPRRGDEALGMPARWRLGLLNQVRAFEASAVGAPGGEALARPGSENAGAETAIAAGCCALFHHAGRGLGGSAGRGRTFSAALDDLIAAPLPEAEAPGEAWPDGARRTLERLFRFWAVGDAALKALLEGELGLGWGDARGALPAPDAPAPQDVVERIALVGGTNVGKTSFLFASEHLRRAGPGGEDDRLPVIQHAWMKDAAAGKRITIQRERWRKGTPSNTERPELIAATGVHSFQAFEIVDMKGEDLLPHDNAVMDYAMRDLFTFRPPAALALMLETVAPLGSRDLVAVERLVTLALNAHDQRSCGSAAGPVPPVHLIANKADRFIMNLRASLLGATAEQQETDAALLGVLCKEALDLGVLMRRAKLAAVDSDRSIRALLMREALEAEVLSASPTLGVAVDSLLHSEGALLEMLISKGATNVVLNFTCSAAPNGWPGLAITGIRAFWSEIWGWAHERRRKALAVQRCAFVNQTENDLEVVKSLLARNDLRLEDETILKAYDDVVAKASECARTLSTMLENGDLPKAAEDFATWLGRHRENAITGLRDAVDGAGKAAQDEERRLKTAVDMIIGHLITLLGIDPEAKIETLIDRQRHGNIVNKGRDWLDEMQVMVAGQDDARSLPALVASNELPEPLVQAGDLLQNIKAEQQDAGFRLLRQIVEQQKAAIRPEASFETALPGGPDGNPRLFHRIHGALLDDCFWKNEPWRKDHWQNNSVALLQGEALLGVKALLIDRAGGPDPKSPPDWRDTLAPLLRLLAEYYPKFPKLAMQRYESDAVKVGVLAQMATRRRVEGLIAALEASLAVRGSLAETPGIAARVRQLTKIEAMLPAVRELGFDAPAFEALVRRGSAKARSDAIDATEGGAPRLIKIQESVRKQLERWPRKWFRAVRNTEPLIQPINAELAALRSNLSGFGSHVLPEPRHAAPKSLDRAVIRLDVGISLLRHTAGDARHERTELAAEMRDLGGKIADMRAAVNAVEETIRTDILVERYRRFLALGLEESALAVASLHDGLGVVDGGIVRAGANLDEIEQRYLTAMRGYFDGRTVL
ncbi:hypothetical protein FHT77_005858 [Rhizobium sp. BK181]|uniref:hypothetical protein n=1 Tax=Rhizobium sp. BK181 TaxID=2587072 RepID=UPI001612685A|nr:hypothetical protein [Rhizobium sp. BK181]MBB3319940.1 hypothetical protein [Rhizobium sp. BK181]